MAEAEAGEEVEEEEGGEDEDTTEEEWREGEREGEEAGGEGIDEDMTALVKEIKFQRTALATSRNPPLHLEAGARRVVVMMRGWWNADLILSLVSRRLIP